MNTMPRDARRMVRGLDGRRRGMSLLVVLLLVSVATVLSYAVLRGQSTAIHIQQNADLMHSARHAAISGLMYGIQQMHTADWEGVDTSMTRGLSPFEQFTVSYAVGDPTLNSGSAEYEDLPYRVTVYCTGYAEDPQDWTRRASYSVRAVLRLIPRAFSTWTKYPYMHPGWPDDWDDMTEYTVYQTHEEDVKLNLPCRLEGDLRFQKKIFFMQDDYPGQYPDQRWHDYLYGLFVDYYSVNRDYRPMNGRVYLPYAYLDSTYRMYFTMAYYRLRFDWSSMASDVVSSNWEKPEDLTTYQIYPGGPVYEITELTDTSQENVALEPDPLTNPLGLFYRDGNCDLQGNVSIRGTLFCKDKVKILGTLQSESVNMPALVGADGPVRLPVMTAKDFEVESTSATTIEGLVAVFDHFTIKEGPDTMPFSLKGHLVTKKLEIGKRTNWKNADWEQIYDDWKASGVETFPIYGGMVGYDPKPKITIVPDDEEYLYHWNDWDNPIFVPHEDDGGGLRWEMLSWKEGLSSVPVVQVAETDPNDEED